MTPAQLANRFSHSSLAKQLGEHTILTASREEATQFQKSLLSIAGSYPERFDMLYVSTARTYSKSSSNIEVTIHISPLSKQQQQVADDILTKQIGVISPTRKSKAAHVRSTS